MRKSLKKSGHSKKGNKLEKRKRVVIDTDVAIGHRDRDVDDALAIIMAANSKELDICGITLTYGNESLENVCRSMDELSSIAGLSNIPMGKGARSTTDFGKTTEATLLLEESCKSGPLTLLCLGPATNLATFLEQKPELAKDIEEVVLVAGRRRGQKFRTGNYSKSHPDLNFEKDPDSVRRLIDKGTRLVFAPFEVSSKVWITEHILELIRRNGTTTAKYLSENCHPWLEFWKRTFSTQLLPVEGFNPFDCLAVAWLTDRDLLFWERAILQVEESDYDLAERAVQGSGATKQYLHADFGLPVFCKHDAGNHGQSSGKREHTYIFDVERELFLERLIARLQ